MVPDGLSVMRRRLQSTAEAGNAEGWLGGTRGHETSIASGTDRFKPSSRKQVCAGQRPSVCGGLRFGRVDLDAALEMSTIFDADARGGNIADHGTVGFNIHTVACIDVSDDFAKNDNFSGTNFRIENGSGADGELVAIQGNGAVDFAIDLQVFSPGDMTIDMKAGSQTSGSAAGWSRGSRG